MTARELSPRSVVTSLRWTRLTGLLRFFRFTLAFGKMRRMRQALFGAALAALIGAGLGSLTAEARTRRKPPPPGCCKVCTDSKACGDSCIPWSATCRKGPGCACQG